MAMTSHSSYQRWRTQRAGVAAIFIGVLFFLGASPVMAQRFNDESFREFDNDEVPSPTELLQQLSTLLAQQQTGDNGATMLLRQLASANNFFSADLTPEQQQRAVQTARQFIAENGLPQNLDQAVRAAAELRERLAEDPTLRQALQPRSQPRTQTPRSQVPVRPPNSNGNPQNTQQMRPRNQRVPPPVNQQPRRNQNVDEPDDPQRPSNNFSAPPIRRLPRALTNRPQRTPGRSPSSELETLATRIDRILLESATRTPLRQGDSSGISPLVNSAFDRLLERLQESSTASGPTIQQQFAAQWDQLQHRTTNMGSNRVSGLSWRPGRVGPLSPDGVSGSWLTFWTLILIAAAVAGWFLWRWRTGHHALDQQTADSRPFQMPQIRAPGDLVKAVDQFLLAQFGLAAQWWHVGYAESCLRDQRPQFGKQIRELMVQYERVRYSRQPLSMPHAELRQSTRKLEALAAAWVTNPTDTAQAPSSEPPVEPVDTPADR